MTHCRVSQGSCEICYVMRLYTLQVSVYCWLEELILEICLWLLNTRLVEVSECCGSALEEPTFSGSFARLSDGERQKGWGCLGKAVAQGCAHGWAVLELAQLWLWLLCAMNGCFMLTTLQWLFLIPNSDMWVLEQCLS